jgi:hypothetical protein
MPAKYLLPEVENGGDWELVLDTAREDGLAPAAGLRGGSAYEVEPRSFVLLVERSLSGATTAVRRIR